MWTQWSTRDSCAAAPNLLALPNGRNTLRLTGNQPSPLRVVRWVPNVVSFADRRLRYLSLDDQESPISEVVVGACGSRLQNFLHFAT